jgi:chemotaxis protein MotB
MAEQDVQDLIVIKRRGSTEPEQVKGGVWKIAFADFMTAMMCFFLVMWLINAANEDTRQAVASYFNPVRLAELNRKGIAEPHATGINTPQRGDPAEDPSETGGTSAEETAQHSREALFRDPYGVLSQIASEVGETEAAGGGGAAAEVLQAFRDPFEPTVEEKLPPAGRQPEGAAKQPSSGAAAFEQEPAGAASAAGPGKEVAMLDPAVDSGVEVQPPSGPVAEIGDAQPPATPLKMSTPPGSAPDTAPALLQHRTSLQEPMAERGVPPIETEIAEAVGTDASGQPSLNLSVEHTGEGVLISLTDDVDSGMFAIGSAEPQAEMVRVMERIASVLKTRQGSITIRGHTDGRPFRTASYDNWRLSTDRAQMAYYMLIRGGLDERRVAAIEGHADRQLKIPDDPEAAGNRRIEILLREDGQ